MNYTDGKWEIRGEDIISSEFPSWIAKVNMDCYKFKHNADLISASPDMLFVLKLLVASIDKARETQGVHFHNEYLNLAKSAIAKAEGRK
jgi:hypothetical protein